MWIGADLNEHVRDDESGFSNTIGKYGLRIMMKERRLWNLQPSYYNHL